jgi:hypothetical protein
MRETAIMGKKNPPAARMYLEIEGEGDGETLVLTVDVKREGQWVRIAKRYSGQSWISLEPGFTVHGTEPGTDYNTIVIEYAPARANLQ